VRRPALDVPRLLLGVASLALPVRATRDRQLEVSGRFKESESLAVALVKGVAAGAEAVLAPPTQDIREALDELPKDLPIMARVPHLLPADDLRYEPALLFDPGEDDDPSGRGGKPAGAAAKDLLPVGLGGSLAGRVLPRMEREVTLFKPASLRGIVVSASATDLAVAGNQPRFFERIMKFARPRHWMAGFETRNLGHLLARLASWGVKPDFVIGAMNPRGVGMMPDPEAVLTAIEQGGVRVIASELRAGGLVSLEEGAAWARQHGAWGVCPELVDMDDVPRELKALAPQAVG